MAFVLRNDLLGFTTLTESWGLAWGDADGDGDADLWLSHHRDPPMLLVNRLDEAAGEFEPINITQTGDQHGSVWADLDGDGDLDLLQLRGGGSAGSGGPPPQIHRLGHQLFDNLGVVNGRPVLVWQDDGKEPTDSRGLYYPGSRGRTPSIFDVNNDGRLDVFVGTKKRPDDQFPSALMVQQPDGLFESRPGRLGFDGNGVDLVVPADFNQDHIPDLFVRNRPGISSIVYGDGKRFAPGGPPLPDGLANGGFALEDLLVADFNNDSTLDIWVVTRTRGGFDSLFLNVGGGRFVDASAQAGLGAEGDLSINGTFGDFDNDGDIDVYTVNAFLQVEADIGNQPNTVWRNTGSSLQVIDGVEVAVPTFVARIGPGFAPSDDNGVGESAGVADANGDGVLDLLVANGEERPVNAPELYPRAPAYDFYLGTANPSRDWLMLDLRGTVSNGDGIGATVFAEAGGLRQMRFAANGSHDKAQNDPRLHFGFGDLAPGTGIDVTIYWPSGVEQVLRGVQPNQVLSVVEGQGLSGADSIVGSARAERITGGAGDDMLTGGAGPDVFVFARATAGDTAFITDFTIGADRLRVVAPDQVAVEDGPAGAVLRLDAAPDAATVTLAGHAAAEVEAARDLLFV